jgi:uncharacterized protein (TIGR00288 family)
MTTERVMLLIDADNVSVDVMEQAVRLLMNQHGAVHVRRAYCTAESAVKHQAAFKRLSIKPMVNLAAGKNSTDIALAVDAIDLVLAERPDVVVIASSDSDFAPLVARLREKGCVVRGIGQEGKTGDETQDAYDDYTVLAHRKAPGTTGAAPATAARRGGGRGAGGGRGSAAANKALLSPQAAAERKTPAGKTPRGQAAGRGDRSERSERSEKPERADRGERGEREQRSERGDWSAPRSGKPLAQARVAPTPEDLAEDEAAASATLAALREATDRASAQQAAAAASAVAQQADAPADAAEGATDTPAPAAKKAARKTAPRKTGKTGKTGMTTDKAAASLPDGEAKPARKTARKTAASKSAVKSDQSAKASKQDGEASALDEAKAVANADALAAQIAATLAAPAAAMAAVAPEPAMPTAAAPQGPRGPAPAQPRTARPGQSSAAVAALPDQVLKILASLPELARGDTVELRLASQRLRDAGLLSKSGSSTKLLGQFADRFELLPPGQPNHVRLRGGKLV